MSIGTLSARILMDASGVQSGMGLTRAEMRLTRQAFVDSATDVQKLETALSTLESARDKGAYKDEEAYAQAVAAVRQQLDPAVKAEQALAAAREAAAQRGQALAASVATSEERRSVRLAEAKSLLDQGAISQETYNRALSQMDAERFEELNAGINTSMQGLEQAAGQLAVFGAAATAAFGGAAYAALDSAAEYEQTTIAFTTLMGNADAAKQTLADLTQFAASTPFQMPQLEKVARGLLGFGLSGEPMLQFMRQMGDAAAATNTDLGELGQIFVKVRGAGRLMGDTFAQLSERGVLFHKDIAAHFGIAESEVAKFISTGQVGFADVEAILAKLTAEGGRYNDAMLAQSQSAAGLSSTLSDNLSIALRGIGEDLLPIQKGFTDLSISAVGAFTDMDPAVRMVVSGTIGLGAALGATTMALTGGVFAATKLYTAYTTMTATLTTLSAATAGATAATGAQTAASLAATGALKGLAAAKMSAVGLMKAGPYLAAAAGIAYLSHTIYSNMPSIVEFNDAMKESQRLAGMLAKREAGQQQEVFDSASTMQGAERVSYLTSQLQRAELEMEGLSARSAMAKEEADRLQPSWLSLGQAGKAMWDAQRAEYDELQQRYGSTAEFVQKLRDEINSTETQTQQAPIEALDKYTAKLQEQIATTGMAADAVELWRLRQEGATNTQLAAVAAMQRQAAAAAAETGLRDDTNALVDSLQTQISEVGRSEAELVRMRLAARGLRPEWLAVVEAMQTRLAAAQETEQVRQKVAQLTDALQEQIVTTGMSAEEIQRWQLAQQGATTDQLAHIAALQGQAAAAREADAARKTAQDAERQQQESLANSIKQTRDGLQEQIATWGMTADQAALAKLAQQGASQSELQELAQLQARLADLQRQKDALQGTEVTIGARGGADLFDAMARARESQLVQQQQPVVAPQPPPVVVQSPQSQSLQQAPQVPYLSRIALGVEALLAKEGIVVEEAKA